MKRRASLAAVVPLEDHRTALDPAMRQTRARQRVELALAEAKAAKAEYMAAFGIVDQPARPQLRLLGGESS